MILRDEKGGVIFAAYRKLLHYNKAHKVELQAMMEGLRLVVEHSNTRIMPGLCFSLIVQLLDLKALSDDLLDRSTHGHLISEIKTYLNDRGSNSC